MASRSPRKKRTGTDVPKDFADEVEAGRGNLQYAQVPAWIIFATTPQAQTCYSLLKLCVRPGTTQAAPTREQLARAVGLKKTDSVDRYRKELEQVGAVDMRTKRRGMEQRTIYTVHWEPPAGFTGPLTKKEWLAREFPEDAEEQGLAAPPPPRHGAGVLRLCRWPRTPVEGGTHDQGIYTFPQLAPYPRGRGYRAPLHGGTVPPWRG